MLIHFKSYGLHGLLHFYMWKILLLHLQHLTHALIQSDVQKWFKKKKRRRHISLSEIVYS